MKELLSNIKTLLFSYTSIIVLLFFAIIQSNQGSYDAALQQLNEIEKRASTYDSDGLRLAIFESANLGSNRINKVATLDKINLKVEFRFPSRSADFSAISKQLQADPPTEFSFGIGNRTIFHPEFTETKGIQSYFVPVQNPLTLESYEALHNRSLESIYLPVFEPDMSKARIEAYAFEVTRYNSIEQINTSSYESVEVVDQLSLLPAISSSPQSDADAKICNLEPVVTIVNERYAFMCSVSEIVLDSITYSGARIIVPAESSVIEVQAKDLLELLRTPASDRRIFDRSFRELVHIAGPYSNLPFEKIDQIIRAEKERNPSTLSVFGAEINIPLLTQLVLPLLTLICLYIYLHIQEALSRSQGTLPDGFWEVPWIALYRSSANQYVLLGQLLLLPMLLVVAISFRSSGGTQVALTWAMFLVLVAVNSVNFMALKKLRAALFHRTV